MKRVGYVLEVVLRDAAEGRRVQEVEAANDIEPARDREPRAVGAELERANGKAGPVGGFPPPCPRVEGRHVSVVVAGHEHPAVRGDGDREHAPPSPRSTWIAAGLRSSAASRLLPRAGVSSSATAWRASSSERSSAARRAPARRGAAPRRSGPRRGRCRAGRARAARDHRRDEQQRHSAEHEPQPALRALGGGAPASRNARSVAFSSSSCVGAPLERGRQPRAAVQVAGIAASASQARAASPSWRCSRRPSRILVQPAAQPRPFAQQRLVRDLDRAVADRQQAAVGEPGDDLGVLAPARPPARRARPGGARSRRPRPRRRAAAARCARPPAAPDRACTNASSASRATAPWTPPLRVVRSEAQPPPVALAPELEQRGGQQRQRARLAFDVGQQRVDELGLDAAGRPAAPGRSIARRSSSRDIGPTSTWLAPSRRASSG